MKNLIEVTRSLHIDILMDAAKLLAEQGIEFTVDNTRPTFDITFTGGGALTEYILKVEKKNVEKATKIVDDFLGKQEGAL